MFSPVATRGFPFLCKKNYRSWQLAKRKQRLYLQLNYFLKLDSMKTKIAFAATGMLLLVLWSCKKSSTTPSSVNTRFSVSATLSGTSEVPSNTSTATGSVSGTYDSATKILSITVTYSGITPNNGHIHKAATGASGPVVFPFSTFSPSPFTYTSVALTSSQQDDLFNSLYYVNLHTTAFPAGEIRGQLIKQ